ncbi:RNA polymerase sigma factor [Adhaeribacter rhizoryzae]|nr:sigma-70 family RNA polymerase sigma factor [Adhaeribacter rhizoryzae]
MQTLTSPVMATDWRHSFITDREKTLTRVYAQTYPMVLHFVKQHNGTPEDAQDLLQEAIILFYEKVMHEQLVLTASATTYLLAICKNKWHQELEKRQRQARIFLTQTSPNWEEPTIASEQTNLDLGTFVAQLGKKCQEILVSFYYFGHNMPQIAAQHAYRNVHTATVQKFKCLERLRQSLANFTINDFR